LDIARDVNRELRDERDPVSALARIPHTKAVKQFPGFAPMGSEVVVGDEDPPVAMAVEHVQFREHRSDRFVTLTPAEVLNDVAELTLKRSAERSLHRTHQGALSARD